MNRPDEQSPDLPATVDPAESALNGTFLVRPTVGWTRIDPIRGLTGTFRLQSQAGDSPADDDLGGPWPRLELVNDAGNLLPFHFLRTGDRMGRAVLKLQRKDGATGTGFLVAPDILLTNHHVLPDRETAAQTVALANYEVSPPNDPAGRQAVAPLDPAALFVTNAELDFTFCGVVGLDFLGVIPLDRERMHVATDGTVTIIQHPRGRPKEISLRDNRVIQADAVVVQYTCDTEPGSSGSPVFNDQWKPVAIHHASVLTDSPEGRRIAAHTRARYVNEGIRLSAIAQWLDSAEAEAEALDHNDRVERLRALFGGLDPRVGFFGALGLWAHGRPATEAVADSYRGRPGVIDLGYWDTRTMAASPGGLRDGAADLARVVADMGLDAWCFSHADPAGLDAICERLWAAHTLDYRAFAVGPPCASGLRTALLVRKSEALAAEPLAGAPPRVLFRVRTRRGEEARVVVVPLVDRRPDGPGPAALARPYGATGPGPDWIFVGDPDLVLVPEEVRRIAAAGGLILAAGDPRDGAFALIADDASPVNRAFVTPNLKPAFDPTGRLSVIRDRAMPASLAARPGPAPIALRLGLDPADPPRAHRPEPDPLPLLEAPPAAPHPPPAAPAVDLDALIEKRLRELLAPALAKILADARGEGDR